MSARLASALSALRQQLEVRQQNRRKERIEKGKVERAIGAMGAHHDFTHSQDVVAFFDAVMFSVNADKNRYLVQEEVASSAAQVPGAPDVGAAAAAEPNAPTLSTEVPIHELVVRGPPPGMVIPPRKVEVVPESGGSTPYINTVHLRPLVDAWTLVAHTLPLAGGEHLSMPARHCLAFMNHELALLTEDQAQKGAVPVALIGKLKHAVQAFAERRTSDTITLLRNALNGDPHNHCLLSILSQVLYYLSSEERTMLPEAREIAQKSIIYSDKVKPERLALYRYLALSTELAFAPERTLEWLRESRLLDPDALCGKEGLLAQRGMHLRAWAMLAQIPPTLWTENEFHALKQVLTAVIGGGAIYQMWFRSALVEANAMSKLPLPDVEEMERLMNTAQAFYEESANALRHLPLTTSPFPWFLRIRYMNTFAQLITVPNFDHVLCMIALSGQAHMENVFPDAELRSLLDDSTLSYWGTWALVTTPFKDVRQPYLLPAEETLQDGHLLAACDTLLAALQEAEKQRVKANLWDDLKAWMPRWQLEHLLAAGTGSNKPRSRFTPNLIPYTHFYRRWQDPIAVSQMASEVIAETGRRGSFASLFEIVAAFEGAARLLDDPVHGLVINQKRALDMAKKSNPGKFHASTNEFSGSGSGILMLLLPVGTLGAMAAIIQMSANWSQAIGLMLALAGLAGVIALNLKKV